MSMAPYSTLVGGGLPDTKITSMSIHVLGFSIELTTSRLSRH